MPYLYPIVSLVVVDATLTLWLAITVINFWLMLLLAVVTVLVLRRQRMGTPQPLLNAAHPAAVSHERETTESPAALKSPQPIALMIASDESPSEARALAEARTEAASVIRNRIKKLTSEV